MDSTFEPHQLCQTCTGIIEESNILRVKSLELETEQVAEEGYRREVESFMHLGDEELSSSADKGCHLCSLLYEQYDRAGEVGNDGQPLTLKIEREFTYMGPGVVSLAVQATETQPGCSSHINTGPYASLSGDDEVKGSPFGSRTSSDGWFTKIETWLRSCRDDHINCHVTATDAKLPARLIDVGVSEPGAESRPLHLCRTSSMRQRPSYLTLSHCWGDAKFLRLLRENHDEFLDRIPEDKVPATFRDAAIVTRRLGFRYLWIDALCIIQDSEADWVAESAKMGDVYRCAVFTIAALWGSDSRSGLFTRCHPLSWEDCVVHIDSRKVRIRGHDRVRVPVGPLLRRGWVFQERALCPRTLFYSKGTVFWECVHCDAGEFHENLLHPLDLDHQGAWASKQHVYYLAKGFERGESKDGHSNYEPRQIRWHHFWCELREQYRRLDFTLQTDRLVAIQGIMELVGFGDNIAGLRKDMMLPDLLWDADRVQTSTPFQDRIAQEPYLAPSWSWASVRDAWGVDNYFSRYVAQERKDDGSAQDQRSIQWAADILETNVRQKPNGQVTGGHLKLRAPLVKINHSLDAYGSWSPDTRRESPALAMGDKFALLLARVCETDISLGHAQYMDFCLVLERHPNQKDAFFRIGILWQNSNDPIPSALFSSLLSDCQKSILNLQ
ncbi:heterokaryon incompatibility protein-domain-containing protein [Xylaria castorea]|nr:heterokaryon incompatibility protein-domain-containing protein [Xylaria castorea]